MKTKIITLTIISLLILSVIGFIIPELATELAQGSEEEVTITIFDQEGRNMAEEGDQELVNENMEIEIREPKYFGLSHDVIAEAEGGNLSDKIPTGSYYDIVVIWKGDEIYTENRKISEDLTIHMTTTPSRMIESWSREQISTSSDLRDITTPHKSFQLGAGDGRSDIYIDVGDDRYEFPTVLRIDGTDHDFQFRNTEPGEYTDWTDDFLIWEEAYHYSASSSEKVGDNMIVLQWQYGYFDTGGAHIDRVVQGAGAGAVAGAIAGSIKPGVGTGIGAIAGAGAGAIGTAVATSIEPELSRTDADGGVGAITLAITPRYTVINSVVVDGTGSTVEFDLGSDNIVNEGKHISNNIAYELKTYGGGDRIQDLAIATTIEDDTEELRLDTGHIKYTGLTDQTYSVEKSGTDCLGLKNPDISGAKFRIDPDSERDEYLDDEFGQNLKWDNERRLYMDEANNLPYNQFEEGNEYKVKLHFDVHHAIDQDNNWDPAPGYNDLELRVYTDHQTHELTSSNWDDIDIEEKSYDCPNNYMERAWSGTMGSGRSPVSLGTFNTTQENITSIQISLPHGRTQSTIPNEYRFWINSFKLIIEPLGVEDELPLLFEDEVISPATRLLRDHIPVYQPQVGTGVTIPYDYTLIALDVRDLPDVTVSLDWASPDIHIYLTRFMLTSEMGNWTETCYILSTDREEGFKDITFILNEGDKFYYNSEFKDYSAWTGPGKWSSVEDWSSVYYNGTNLNYPSPEDWGLGGWWDETRWDWNQWWNDIGPLVKLALIGIGLLIIGLIILIVAPWIIFGLIKALVFIFKQIGSSTRKIVQALRGEGGWGGWNS